MTPRRRLSVCPHPLATALALLLPACGHISNASITEDAAFLAALPSASALGPYRPDGETPTDAEDDLPASGRLPGHHPFERVTVATPTDHARSTSPHSTGELSFQAQVSIESPVGALNPVTPAVKGTVALPQTSDPDGDPDEDVDAESPAWAWLAPRSQADEMFDYLSAQMGAVYAVADLTRATPPTLADPDARTWDSLMWRGAPVTAEIDAVADDTYAWTFNGKEDRGFAEGAWTATPSAGEWQGWLALDASAWSELFGVEGAGQMDVDYDTRAGAELQLSFAGSSYADDADTCTGVTVLRRINGLVQGRVTLGPVQRYRYIDGEGDYQFATLRQHGCDAPAVSTVRVRWSSTGGRADALIRIGTTQWTRWSQCWMGPSDQTALSYEGIVNGDDTGAVVTETGSPSACAWADFGEVDAEVTVGEAW